MVGEALEVREGESVQILIRYGHDSEDAERVEQHGNLIGGQRAGQVEAGQADAGATRGERPLAIGMAPERLLQAAAKWGSVHPVVVPASTLRSYPHQPRIVRVGVRTRKPRLLNAPYGVAIHRECLNWVCRTMFSQEPPLQRRVAAGELIARVAPTEMVA